jgi:RHS repeat-associated protein
VKNAGSAPTACGDTTNVGNVLDFSYNFSLGTADNGNVTGITNNRDNTRSQSFTYDALNRIASAQTQTAGVTIPNSNCWGLTFGYDAWGNLLSSFTTGPAGCSEPLPLNVSATTSNQISGYCYDAAGNMLDPGACPTAPNPHAYAYNVENQLVSAAGVSYAYDGDGKRVQKSSGKLYWYGMGSDPLDETDLAGNTNNSGFNEYVFFGGKRIARRGSSNNVSYYFADHVGTARVVTNSTGGILDDSDFYPFGGERPILSSSGNPYKFTSKERDLESGLDDFGARYYSSAIGRFLTPDEAPPNLFDPQSLNLYSYVLNNPLRYVDPDGHFASEIHFGLTSTALQNAGYSSDVSRSIAFINASVDACCNDNAHAIMHSQTPTGETPEQAEADQSAFVEASLDAGAEGALRGDQKAGETGLGQALHAVQDEKHEFIDFAKHTGNPVNDRKTPQGKEQEKTDYNPTDAQLQKAAQRTVETIQRFEQKIWDLGRKQDLTDKQIRKRIKEFKRSERDRQKERRNHSERLK